MAPFFFGAKIFQIEKKGRFGSICKESDWIQIDNVYNLINCRLLTSISKNPFLRSFLRSYLRSFLQILKIIHEKSPSAGEESMRIMGETASCSHLRIGPCAPVAKQGLIHECSLWIMGWFMSFASEQRIDPCHCSQPT